MKEFVVLHILHPTKKLVYMLKKDRPNMPQLHNKWVGFGGSVEEFDADIYNATIREIEEELNIKLRKNDLKLRGFLFDSKNNHKVWIFITNYNKILKEGEIKGEGVAKYLPFDYFNKHPEEFPWGNLHYLDKLLNSDKEIEVRV